ncbi:PREDICTED: RAS guanyl-releasing protein 4 [Elephantulus edwardii]|uniref:RAS guanyl-releasing protein 4 n=1 Tax=Elephantulus edwardii TaxID=28737 RepID=UPI0003F0E986|nr:PREDICTED: RAS guanyl-releasing protein 4 [Elephantulus edwardii]
MNRKDSKRKSHQECLGVTGARGRPRQARRHKTCPSPGEISKVMASMALGVLREGCSEDELLEKCIQSFDSTGSLRHGAHVLHMMLAMHSWVLPSAHLAARLLTLYPPRYQKATGKMQELRRLQICHLVRYWLIQHPKAVHQEPQLQEAIDRFWATVDQEGGPAQRSLGGSSNLLSPDGPGPPPPISSPGLGKKCKVSLIFDHLETGELAQHLTYLEFRSFQAITPQDLRSYVLQGSVRDCPALEGSVGLSNSVSRWVQVMVLSRPGPTQRAQVLDKFIHVAQKLHQLQNFNTLMAVTGGLCHSAISRLKDSHSHLSPDSTKVLVELTELLAAHNNYARYRRAWASCVGFRLPVLGVHLKDLVSLHQAQPDRLPDGRLHLPKLNGLYLRLQELAALQGQRPPCSANEDLLHLLMLSLDLFYTEDEIYELSYAREPRCPKSLPPSPFKAPLVVEWAPGVTPKPDRVTLGRHVEQLVESVFKNYDPEGRGTISQEDFERLSGNFPFACHGLHPPPCQGHGSFSREELTGYLLRASAICSKLGLAFLHTFHEVTFRKPTFCDNCNGFLWGVTKQGYRCRDCGLCCHKHCRDQVKVECKKLGVKGSVAPPGASFPSTSAAHVSRGSEENLPDILSPESETESHLCHAWTQTEASPPFWGPEMKGIDVLLKSKGRRLAEQQRPVATQGTETPQHTSNLNAPDLVSTKMSLPAGPQTPPDASEPAFWSCIPAHFHVSFGRAPPRHALCSHNAAAQSSPDSARSGRGKVASAPGPVYGNVKHLGFRAPRAADREPAARTALKSSQQVPATVAPYLHEKHRLPGCPARPAAGQREAPPQKRPAHPATPARKPRALPFRVWV